jgi:hypothetical protein
MATARTPGARSAALVSIARMFACGDVERTMRVQSMPGSLTSLV